MYWEKENRLNIMNICLRWKHFKIERKKCSSKFYNWQAIRIYSVNLRILHIIALLFIYPLRPVCKENLMVSKVTIKLTLNIKKNNLAITHNSVKATSKYFSYRNRSFACFLNRSLRLNNLKHVDEHLAPLTFNWLNGSEPSYG